VAPPYYPHESQAYDGDEDMPGGDGHRYGAGAASERRPGLLTIGAVVALAVVGTAGAFGYRSLSGGSASSSPPPVIRASDEPSKVQPPPSTTADQGSKFSYDRFADRGKNEQVVTREETPVDPSSLVRNAPPRTVFPGAPVPSSTQRGNNVATTASANPPSALGDPRRVRTVPIVPDQADVAASSPTQGRQQGADASQPRDINSMLASQGAASGQGANAPLAIAPQQAQPQAPAQPQSRMAAVTPAGGGYLVQVSSQRSEADAQASFRSIQSRYASVLSGHPHMIRRADLGSRGVYYRAMVGPFGTREDAVRLCVSLKQAGGDCVVQQ